MVAVAGGRMSEQFLPGIPNEISDDAIGEVMGIHALTIGTPTNETLPESEERGKQFLTRTGETIPKSGEQDEQYLPQTDDAFLKLEQQEEELLPGILNDITFKHITTKLPWRALYKLSLVSPGWRRAMQNRRFYDERVRTQSTETLIVHSHYCKGRAQKIALFSTRDKCCYELPPIPQLDGGIPSLWKYVSWDGKIYVLGGWKDFKSDIHGSCFVGAGKDGGNELYVLDLVGQRHWNPCASMQGQRHRFGCGAIDGKIYVFGGVDADLDPLPGSEVYDIEADSWSPITPMPRMRFHPDVEILGNELFVHGGTCYDPANANDFRGLDHFIHHARRFADVYDTVKPEWRLIDPFGRDLYERVFSARGQFYSISEQGVHVFDPASKSWTDLHSHSFANLFAAAIGPIDDVRILLCPAVAVDDELLVVVYWYKITIEHGFDKANNGGYFLRSTGFGGQNRELSWQILSKCSSCSGDAMFSVEL